MNNNNSNYEMAQAISNAIGNTPIPYESVYSICLDIYRELGGNISEFDSIYSILLEILPLTKQGIGYVFESSSGSFAHIYRQDVEDGGKLIPNTVSGLGANAEGYDTTASGDYGSHAEGYGNIASRDAAHAEGSKTTASGIASHSEGSRTTATATNSHAEGKSSQANGYSSHAEGTNTETRNNSEHAQGSFNTSHRNTTVFDGNSGNTLHSIGIGTANNARKNAIEVMQNGDMYLLGIGGYQGTNIKSQDATIKTLQEYILSLEARITTLENA